MENMRDRTRRLFEDAIRDAPMDDRLHGAAVTDQDDDLALLTQSGWVYLVTVQPARITVQAD